MKKIFLVLLVSLLGSCGDINLTNNGDVQNTAQVQVACLENCEQPIVNAEGTPCPEAEIKSVVIETTSDTKETPIATPEPTITADPSSLLPTVAPTSTPEPTPTPTIAPTPSPTPTPIPFESAVFVDPAFCTERIENDQFVYCEETVDWDTVLASIPSGYELPLVVGNFYAIDVVQSNDDALIRALIHPAAGEQRIWALQDCSQFVGSEKNNCINKTNNFRSIWTYNISTDKGAGFPAQNSSQAWNLAEIAIGVRYDGCAMGIEFLGEDCYREKWEALAHPLYKRSP